MTAIVLQPRITGTTVTTGKCRASYAHVFEPQPDRNPKPGAKPKYGISLLVPKTDKATIQMLQEAIKQAGTDKFGPKFIEQARAGRMKMGIRDGDKERADDPAYVGHYFVNCRSNNKPIVLARDAVTQITNPADFRSGDYCRATINAFAYDTDGNKGVSFGLIHLQKVENGEPLGAAGPAPSTVYDAIPGDETPPNGSSSSSTGGDDDFPM